MQLPKGGDADHVTLVHIRCISAISPPLPMKLVIKAVFWFALAIAFVLAVVPAKYDPVHLWDKVQHFAAFATLTTLGVLAYGRARLLTGAIGLVLFGGLIEVVQGLPFVHRDADFHDWLADALAISIVAFAIWAVRVALTGRQPARP